MDRNQLRIPFDYPLNKDDSPIQTYGYRANNPDICANNSLPDIYAFTSDDKVCKKPSRAWEKQFAKLSEMEDA